MYHQDFRKMLGNMSLVFTSDLLSKEVNHQLPGDFQSQQYVILIVPGCNEETKA